jgi:Domain of unknown function (DUF6504)
MRRIRGEPVDVWLRHGKPARFVWRGRLYIVLFVLDHRAGRQAPGSAGPDTQEPAAPEFWLVEATAQQATPPGTFELRHDLESDRWSLSRN